MKNELMIMPVAGHELADTQLVKECHDVLARVFPNYTWIIGLDEEDLGGVMTIMCAEVNEQMLGFPNWGYVLKLSRVYQDMNRRCVMLAGGEILESAGLNTGINKDEYIRQIEGVNHKKFPLTRIGI